MQKESIIALFEDAQAAPFAKDSWQHAVDNQLVAFGRTSQEFANPHEAMAWLAEMHMELGAYTVASLTAQRDQALARVAELEKDAARYRWLPIETAPKDGRSMLLGYPNGAGKWRTVRGQWFSDAEIAETWEEDGDERWYETSVECEDLPNCWAIEPTHWMPLPAAALTKGN